MSTVISIGDVIRRGVELRPHEAIALAQSVAAVSTDDPSAAHSIGPPTIETVHIAADGSVTCPGVGRPSAFEIGLFLQSVLSRRSAGRVPGGLQYTIARALMEVEAPPFESVSQLSQVLKRHEHGDRAIIIRELFDRAAAATRVGSASIERSDDSDPQVAAAPVADAPVRVDRRRTMPQATTLRRQLREADRDLFLQRSPLPKDPADERHGLTPDEAPPARKPNRFRTVFARPLAIAMMALLVAVEVARLTPDQSSMIKRMATFSRLLHRPAAPPPASVSIAPRPSPTAIPLVGERARTGRGPVATDASTVDGLPAPEPALDRSVKTPTGTTPPADPRGGRSLQASARVPTVVRAVEGSDDPEFSPSFASDGTALFFQVGQSTDAPSALPADSLSGGLQVMRVVDDGAKNSHVQPSPDGTRIAFDSDRDGERGVYVARRDGADVTRVSGPGFAAVPTWSPDGDRLVFARAERDRPHVWNLWLLTVASGDTRQLTRFRTGQTWNASWFPDGRRICYTHEDRLVILDVASGIERKYPTPVAQRRVSTPAVSPDGRHVVFQVYKSGAWLIDLNDGSMLHLLTDTTAEQFAWSPDGRRIAFHSKQDGQWGIWVMAPT